MRNPFVYGKEVSGNNFCNRKNEIRELKRDMLNSQNVIIFSPRRFGKTSLIKKVFDECLGKNMLGIYVDLYPMLNEQDFIAFYATAIAEAVFGKVKRSLKDVAKLFKKVRLTATLDQDGKPTWGVDFKGQESLPSLKDVLEGLNRYIKKRNKKAVVCFDEFQQVGLLKSDKIIKTMRSVFQKHHNISYIFMGSKRHLIYDMFNNPHQPFYKSSKPLPLDIINNDDFAEFISKKFTLSKKTISGELIEKIIIECESHPYYIQYLCHIIWEKTIDKKSIDNRDVVESVKLLLDRESSTYEATWDLLTVKQRQALLALAKSKSEDKIFSSEFLQQHNLGSASTLQENLKSLIEKDLIDKKVRAYKITDVFFKKWLSHL